MLMKRLAMRATLLASTVACMIHALAMSEDNAISEWDARELIIAGTEVQDPNRYPWMVLLNFNVMDINLSPLCGGVLISPTAVLTAAHCFFQPPSVFPNKRSATVYVGAYDRTELGPPVLQYETTMNNVVLHPQFGTGGHRAIPQDGYDFAIIKLDPPVTSIDPVAINFDDNVPLFDQVSADILGWGVDENAGAIEKLQDVLNTATVTTISNEDCENGYPGTPPTGFDINESNICAGVMGPDAPDSCVGDSGGPLFLNGGSPQADVVIGLVSWGTACGSAPPGVYARISTAREFIVQNVPDLAACANGGIVEGRLGQGCDGIDNDCNGLIDECEEDTVKPMIALPTRLPKYPFSSLHEAIEFMEEYLTVIDDCALKLVKSLDVLSQTSHSAVLQITARDPRCNTSYSSNTRRFEVRIGPGDKMSKSANGVGSGSYKGGKSAKGDVGRANPWAGSGGNNWGSPSMSPPPAANSVWHGSKSSKSHSAVPPHLDYQWNGMSPSVSPPSPPSPTHWGNGDADMYYSDYSTKASKSSSGSSPSHWHATAGGRHKEATGDSWQ